MFEMVERVCEAREYTAVVRAVAFTVCMSALIAFLGFVLSRIPKL